MHGPLPRGLFLGDPYRPRCDEVRRPHRWVPIDPHPEATAAARAKAAREGLYRCVRCPEVRFGSRLDVGWRRGVRTDA